MPDDIHQDFAEAVAVFRRAVPLEHWVSRIAINTCINQIQAEKARPELREADLSEEQAAVVRNLAATTDELAPDQSFASRQLVEHLMKALKPAERLVIDLLYLQADSRLPKSGESPVGAARS